MLFLELTVNQTDRIVSIRVDTITAVLQDEGVTLVYQEGNSDPFYVKETYTEVMDGIAEVHELLLSQMP